MAATKKVAKVARTRLTEKVNRVNDVRVLLQRQVEHLEKLDAECTDSIENVSADIERTFADFFTILNLQKVQFLEKLKEISQNGFTTLVERKITSENVLDHCTQSLELASQLLEEKEQTSIVHQYSVISQQLEDSLINALTLLDDTSYEPLAQLFSSFSSLKIQSDSILNTIDSELQPFKALLDNIQTQLQELSQYLPLILPPTSNSLQSELHASTLSLVSIGTEEGPIQQESTPDVTSRPSQSSDSIDIPNLLLPPDSILNAIIVSVSTLTSLIVQPYSGDLVELSRALREHIFQEELTRTSSHETNEEVVSSLRIGQVCCARFSIDQYWYRARVLDLIQEENEDSAFKVITTSVHVLYVDYGNEEIVPPSCVLPLPFSFAGFPAQALTLTIHDVALPPCTPSTTTVSSLCHWMSIVLAGIVIQASIISCGTENNIVADVCVPAEVLVSSESITLLQQAQLHLPKWLNFDNNPVHLGSLLCSFFSETYDIIETTNDLDNGASPMYAAVSVTIPEMMVPTHSLSSQASSINTSTFPLQCHDSPLQVISLPTQTQTSIILSEQPSIQLPYGAVPLPNLKPTVSVNQFPLYTAVTLDSCTSLTTTVTFVTLPSTVVSSVSNDSGQISHGIQNDTCTNLNGNSTCQKWPVSDLSDESLNLEVTFPKFEETGVITRTTHLTNITSEQLTSKLVALETQDAASYSTPSSSLSNEDALIPPPPAFSNDSSYMSELVHDTTPHVDCISDPSDDLVVTSLPSSLQVASNSQELNAQISADISVDAQDLSIKQDKGSPEQSQVTSKYEIDVTLNDKVVLSHDIIAGTPPEQLSIKATSSQLPTEDRALSTPELVSPNDNLIAEAFFENKTLSSMVDRSLTEEASLLNEAPHKVNRPSFKQPSDLSEESEFILQVCSVKSPSLFYVYTEHTVQMLHLLEHSLAEYYSDPAHRQCFSELNIGAMCCVETLISDSTGGTVMLLCRGVVLSALDEYSLCSVFCVDYGFVTQVLIQSIFILEVQFIDTPVQCLCCSLFGIAPVIFRNEGTASSSKELMPSQIPLPPSPLSSPKRNGTIPPLSLDNGNDIVINVTTRTVATEKEQDKIRDNALGEDEESNWSKNAIDYFKSLVENKVLVGVVKDKQVDEKGCYRCPSYGILLYDTNGQIDILINRSLVEMGQALLVEGAPFSPLPPPPNSPQTEELLKSWNPMQADFLSQRNVYDVDDEDVGSVLLGYKSSSQKVCRFYNTLEGCRDGDKCRFQHLPEGVYDEHKVETFSSPPSPVLPSEGSWVLVVVTAAQSLTRFMVQILGPAEALLHEIQTVFVKSKFQTLLEEMDRYFLKDNQEKRTFVPPNLGELVAVWCESDGHWYRAITNHQYDTQLKVDYIDTGYEEWVSQELVRPIVPQFIHLPIQAIECNLAGTKLTEHSHKAIAQSKEILQDLVIDKVLLANVIWRDTSGILGLELYEITTEEHAERKTELSLNKRLLEMGLVAPVNESKETRRPSSPAANTMTCKLIPG